jgi:cell division septal protein FtsQ
MLFALVLATFVVGGSAFVGWLKSEYFQLREVVVTSADPSVAEEVRSQLTLLPNPNTMFYPLGQLEAQAMRCPRVLRVDISRELPNRIVMAIVERQPRLALRGDRDYILVDAEGVLLFHTSRPPVTLPRVEGAQVGTASTGGRLSAEAVRCALECEEGARKGGMGLSFTLNLRTRYDLRLRTPSGTDVRLGGPDNLVRKVIAAAAIERHVLQRHLWAEYIDVRVPGQETWKPRQLDKDASSTKTDAAAAKSKAPPDTQSASAAPKKEQKRPQRPAPRSKPSSDAAHTDAEKPSAVGKPRQQDKDAPPNRTKKSADQEPKSKPKTRATSAPNDAADRTDSTAQPSKPAAKQSKAPKKKTDTPPTAP